MQPDFSDPMFEFDLIIEPLLDGMIFIGVKADVLPELEALLDDSRDDFKVGLLCGGCARKHLEVISEQPDLLVAQAVDDGKYLTPLNAPEERRALLDRLSHHIH
jgi:hypothetical protein